MKFSTGKALGLFAIAMFVACSGRTGGPTAQIAGQATGLGDLIKSGEIVVYEYQGGEVGVELARTKFEGEIRVTLPSYSGPLLIRLEKAVIIDLATAEEVKFEEGDHWEVALPTGSSVVTTAKNEAGDAVPSGQALNINPLTTLANAYASTLIAEGGDASESIDAAYAEFAKYLGFDLVKTLPSSIRSALGALDNEDMYGIYLVAYSQLASDISTAAGYTPGKRFTMKDLTNVLVRDVKDNALIDGMEGDVALREVTYRFTDQTLRMEWQQSVVAAMANDSLNGSGLSYQDVESRVSNLLTLNVKFLPSLQEPEPIIDHTPPEVTIVSPEANGFFHKGISVEVQAVELDSEIASLQVFVKGVNVELADEDVEPGHFVASLDSTLAIDGEVSIEATAVNKDGFSQTKSVTFYVDNSEPKISFSLTEGDIKIGNFTVEVTAEDAGGKDLARFDVTLNGRSVVDASPEAGLFTYDVRAIEDQWGEGPFLIRAIARDEAGNEVDSVRTVVINNVTFNQQDAIGRAPLGALTNEYGWFNGSASNAGDVNEDGYDDLLVVDSKSPYVRLGAADGMFGDAWTIAGGDWNSAAAHCDVNGDGHPDVVVGSTRGATGGLVRVYFGPMSGASQFTNGHADFEGEVLSTTLGSELVERAGWRVKCGQMDGALGDEIVYIPAPLYGAGLQILPTLAWWRLRILSWGGGSWKVYDSKQIAGLNWHGTGSTPVHPDARIAGPVDVNGDGYADFIITNVGKSRDFFTTEAQAYTAVLFGGGGGSFRLSGDLYTNDDPGFPAMNGVFWPLYPHALGDLDGDGYDEVGLGEMNWGLEGEYFGTYGNLKNKRPSLTVFWGGPRFPATRVFYHPTNTKTQIRFGQGAATGDFNGDGKRDIAISAPYQVGGSGNGDVVVFYGPSFTNYEIRGSARSSSAWIGAYMVGMEARPNGRDSLIMSSWGDWTNRQVWGGIFEMLYDSL